MRSARVRPDELSAAIVLLPDAEPPALLPVRLVPESAAPIVEI